MANGRAAPKAISDQTGIEPGEGLRAEAEASQGDQLDMLAAMEADEADDFARQFPKVASSRQLADTFTPPPKRGRPAGSRNKATKDTLRLLQAKGFTDPLVFMARIMSMTPDELKRAYGLKGAEALSQQLRAAGDLAPYLHSKQPQGVKLDGMVGAPVQIIFGGPGWAQPAAPDIRGGQAEAIEATEYEVATPDISSTYDETGAEVSQDGSLTDDPDD